MTWPYDLIAPFYDDDMGRSQALDDLAGYRPLLPAAPARVLDVGCGTGRISLYLARQGHDVVAVDRSLPMVQKLRGKIVPAGGEVVAAVMDARALGIVAGGIDAVLFGYCGFQYLTEDADVVAFLDGARRAIAPGGRLILDVFVNRPGLASTGFSHDYDRMTVDGRLLRRWKRITPVAARVNRIERHYCWGDEEVQTVSRQRWYPINELIALLAAAGWRVVGQLADYRSGPVNDDTRFFALAVERELHGAPLTG